MLAAIVATSSLELGIDRGQYLAALPTIGVRPSGLHLLNVDLRFAAFSGKLNAMSGDPYERSPLMVVRQLCETYF
jgi:hypothetical protein